MITTADAFSRYLVSVGWELDISIDRLLSQLNDEYAGMEYFTKTIDGVLRDMYVDSDCIYISNSDRVGVRRIEFADPTLFDEISKC